MIPFTFDIIGVYCSLQSAILSLRPGWIWFMMCILFNLFYCKVLVLYYFWTSGWHSLWNILAICGTFAGCNEGLFNSKMRLGFPFIIHGLARQYKVWWPGMASVPRKTTFLTIYIRQSYMLWRHHTSRSVPGSPVYHSKIVLLTATPCSTVDIGKCILIILIKEFTVFYTMWSPWSPFFFQYTCMQWMTTRDELVRQHFLLGVLLSHRSWNPDITVAVPILHIIWLHYNLRVIFFWSAPRCVCLVAETSLVWDSQ